MGRDLKQILSHHQPVLMDGALGTELERRGLAIEERGWSAFSVRDHGEVIQSIHEDYLKAGSILHIVNSFALAKHVLEPIELENQFVELNRRSVALFDQAVTAAGMDRSDVWAAGSLSTFSAGSDRSALPELSTLQRNCREQAEILSNAGVDLFALEMLFDVEVTSAMLEAVKPFGLPIILGFTCSWAPGSDCDVVTTRGLDGEHRILEDLLESLKPAFQMENLIVSIMHSDLDVTDRGLALLKDRFDGPLAIYPNSGEFTNLQMDFDTVCSPSQFAEAAIGWIESGVAIVGGCCGIGPSHISELKSKLEAA